MRRYDELHGASEEQPLVGERHKGTPEQKESEESVDRRKSKKKTETITAVKFDPPGADLRIVRLSVGLGL
jgi:hypothetical protein